MGTFCLPIDQFVKNKTVSAKLLSVQLHRSVRAFIAGVTGFANRKNSYRWPVYRDDS